jgi:predicted N-acetyltransferase YhbS
MGELVLRQAMDADVATIVAVVHAAFDEYRGRLDPPSGAHLETAEIIRQKMIQARVLLAQAGGEVIGCVFYESEGDHLYLSRLAVLPSWRGRGIGGRLLEAVERLAEELHCRRVRLGVRIALAPLRAYYERRGYQPVEYCTHAGYTEPTYVMLQKDLHRSWEE